MQVYNYFRSGTSHRLRIALALKGLDYEYVPVDLASGAHLQGDFRSVNPQALVPALVVQGHTLIQSPAIIEWLEETHPEPPLLPADASGRARVRAMAAVVACDIHPLNNRRVLLALQNGFGADKAAVDRWTGTWISDGFDTLESMLAADRTRGAFCHGGRPSIADVHLIPQVLSSRRFGVDTGRWPLICAVEQACNELAAFQKAAPAVQPDAPAQ